MVLLPELVIYSYKIYPHTLALGPCSDDLSGSYAIQVVEMLHNYWIFFTSLYFQPFCFDCTIILLPDLVISSYKNIHTYSCFRALVRWFVRVLCNMNYIEDIFPSLYFFNLFVSNVSWYSCLIWSIILTKYTHIFLP